MRAIELSAASDETTVDDWSHHELIDFAGTVATAMERAVRGIGARISFPGKKQREPSRPG